MARRGAGALDLVGQQQTDGLEALLASVDVVAQKEVVALGREATVLEQAQQVEVLPVQVPCADEVAAWMSAQLGGYTKRVAGRQVAAGALALPGGEDAAPSGNASVSERGTHRRS